MAFSESISTVNLSFSTIRNIFDRLLAWVVTVAVLPSRMLCSLSPSISGGSLEITVDTKQRPCPRGILLPSPPLQPPPPLPPVSGPSPRACVQPADLDPAVGAVAAAAAAAAWRPLLPDAAVGGELLPAPGGLHVAHGRLPPHSGGWHSGGGLARPAAAAAARVGRGAGAPGARGAEKE